MSQKWYRSRPWRMFMVLASFATMAWTMPTVADAYSIQLIHPHGFREPFRDPANNAELAFDVGSGGRNQRIEPNSQIPLGYGMLGDMAHAAVSVPSRALWSMYPASVRGRVFGGTGADPITAFSSSGW